MCVSWWCICIPKRGKKKHWKKQQSSDTEQVGGVLVGMCSVLVWGVIACPKGQEEAPSDSEQVGGVLVGMCFMLGWGVIACPKGQEKVAVLRQ